VSVAVEALTSLAELPGETDREDSWAGFRRRVLEWLEKQTDIS